MLWLISSSPEGMSRWYRYLAVVDHRSHRMLFGTKKLKSGIGGDLGRGGRRAMLR